MNAYEHITNTVLSRFTDDTLPWQGAFTTNAWPRSYPGGFPVQGASALILGMEGRKCPHWITKKDVKRLKLDVEGDPSYGLIRHLERCRSRRFSLVPIYNLEQIPEMQWDIPKRECDPFDCAEAILYTYTKMPRFVEGCVQPGYIMREDTIFMPSRYLDERLLRSQWYVIAFHELVHSTGHKSRLDRYAIMHNYKGGAKPFTQEELTAELGATMICHTIGMDGTIPWTESYVQDWRNALTKSPQMFLTALEDAASAAQYIINHSLEEKEDVQDSTVG